MKVLHLEGTPRVMGETFGEICREQIQAFYAARLTNAIEQAQQHGGRKYSEDGVLHVAASCLAISEGFDPDGYAELCGIAHAADLRPEQVWALNGLTDLRDVLSWSDKVIYGGGCSSFVLQGDRTTHGRLICGQTWDLATDNMPFVVGVHRKPADAPQTWCLTTVGCLSLIGMNEEGVAIGTTNLRTTDARIGVGYLSIIHKALACRDVATAATVVTSAPRAGGHYYYVCGPNQAAAIECTATRAHRHDLTRGFHVECNHVLVAENAKLEGDTPKASSLCRFDRMRASIGAAPDSSLDEAALRGFLGNHDDGAGAVCRHDLDGVSTNGAVIMTPGTPSVLACHGYPCEATWIDLLAS